MMKLLLLMGLGGSLAGCSSLNPPQVPDAPAGCPLEAFELSIVHATAFQRFVHGDPATVAPDLIPLPRPDVVYDSRCGFETADVVESDAGVFTFRVPSDAGYFVRGSYGNDLRSAWAFSHARTVDLGFSELGYADSGTTFVRVPGVLQTRNALDGGTRFEFSSPQAGTMGGIVCEQAPEDGGCRGSFFFGFLEPAAALSVVRGDVVYVQQREFRVFADGGDYQYVARRGRAKTFSVTDGGSCEVEFNTPDASIDVDFDLEALDSAEGLALIHARARATENQVVFPADAYPWQTPGLIGRPRSYTGLFAIDFPRPARRFSQSVPLVRLPTEVEWTPRIQYSLAYSIPFEVDGGTADYFAFRGGIAALSLSAVTTLTPHVFPPSSIAVDGQSVRTPLASAVTSSTSPTFSWTPSSSGIRPTRYVVTVAELTTLPNGLPSFTSIHTTVTPDTEMRVMPGVVKRGGSCVLSVTARAQGSNADSQPFEHLRENEYAGAVSELWQVAP